MKQRIAVLGSGWLGLALVERLVAGGQVVRASYRRRALGKRLLDLGAEATALDLPDHPGALPEFLDGIDTLIVTLPPGGRRHGARTSERYLYALGTLTGRLAGIHVVYTSSTGVYGSKVEGVVTEATAVDPATDSARAVVAAETWLAGQTDRLTVLRLAGLYGPDRDPADFFRNRSEVPDGDAPVNMVHRADVVRAIEWVVARGLTGTFNVSAATHPEKRTFYGRRLQSAGRELPRFLNGGAAGKRIDSGSLRALGWQPVYDDLMS